MGGGGGRGPQGRLFRSGYLRSRRQTVQGVIKVGRGCVKFLESPPNHWQPALGVSPTSTSWGTSVRVWPEFFPAVYSTLARIRNQGI